jgi:hypothetical protein
MASSGSIQWIEGPPYFSVILTVTFGNWPKIWGLSAKRADV